MTEIQISQEMHQDILKELRNEYVREFGFDHALNTRQNAKSYSKAEYTSTYARNISFWASRIPTIDPDDGIDMRLVAKHAICTNAVQNLRSKVRAMNIEPEVDALLETQD